jgi:hypothetical protein
VPPPPPPARLPPVDLKTGGKGDFFVVVWLTPQRAGVA